jgi:hypothetical protein
VYLFSNRNTFSFQKGAEFYHFELYPLQNPLGNFFSGLFSHNGVPDAS